MMMSYHNKLLFAIYLLYVSISKFRTILEKNHLKPLQFLNLFGQVHFSVKSFLFLTTILSDEKGLTVLQKSSFSTEDFS